MKKQVIRFATLIPILTFVSLLPLVAHAQGAIDALGRISNLLSKILPILVSIGVLYFIWGVVQYVIAGGEEAKKKGRDHIIYGIIGLAVIISVWGLVYILAETFGVKGTPAQDVSNLVSVSTGSCPVLQNGVSKLPDFMNYVTCVIGKSVIPLIFALAMVFFIWGAVNFFIINANEEAKRGQGKQFMIWGIIALAVMVSVWGLVNVVAGTFGFSSSYLPQVHP